MLNKIRIIHNKSDHMNLIHSIVNTNQTLSVGFLNQHAYNLIEHSAEIEKSFDGIDILLRDGIGIKLALELNHKEAGVNLNGTDFIPQLVKEILEFHGNNDLQLFCFGTEEEKLRKGASNLFLEKKHHEINGFENEDVYIDYLRKNSSDVFNLIILGMGMPKQEHLSNAIKKNIKGVCVIICGGAIIDFMSGEISRAPLWVRNNGLEWLFRLSKEPFRLFKRYVIGIPVFLIRIVLKKLKG